MTDTIFFDLDNTLLDFSRAERAALSKTLEALGVRRRKTCFIGTAS